MLEKIGTQTITTKRLVLRKFTKDDAESAYRNYTYDPEVTKYLTWPAHANVDVTRSFMDYQCSLYADDLAFAWAITIDGEVIGSITVVSVDESTESCEIGYCIGKKWWNKGIMTEAFTVVIAYLFEKVGFNCIRAGHDVENPASGRVMAKCGLKPEGVLRAHLRRSDGAIVDVMCYSILRSEYRGITD